MQTRSLVPILLAVALSAESARADDAPGARSLVNTSSSLHVKFQNPDLDAVRWTGGFWVERFELCHEVTIPALFEVMQKPDNSANFQNFRIAAGLAEGEFYGNHWSDGDCYKLIESAAAVYCVTADPEPDRAMDQTISLVSSGCLTERHLLRRFQP
jgi:uncharacterized protein